MERPLKEILFDELQKRDVTVYRFARLSGIPENRIKAWKRGEGNPKAEDAEKIKQWLGQKTIGEETISPGRYIEKLERMNEVLQESIQLSLNAVLTNQKQHQQGMAQLSGELIGRLDEISEALHTLEAGIQKSSGKGSAPPMGKKGRVKP